MGSSFNSSYFETIEILNDAPRAYATALPEGAVQQDFHILHRFHSHYHRFGVVLIRNLQHNL